jgi:nitroreductase
MSFLSNLNWRYATKKFDTTKKVSEENLEKIIEAIRMTPTSFGLQPYHFYVVSNQAIKDKIQAAAWNQPQIGSSSHLIVFAARTDLMETKEEYFTLMSGGNGEIRAQLKWFEDMMDGFLTSKSEGELFAWASKQVYIAHGFAIAAAAELQIDSCGMEGADFTAVGDILGLPTTQKALVLLPIGYRAEGEAPRGKVRFSKEALFTEVK